MNASGRSAENVADCTTRRCEHPNVAGITLGRTATVRAPSHESLSLRHPGRFAREPVGRARRGRPIRDAARRHTSSSEPALIAKITAQRRAKSSTGTIRIPPAAGANARRRTGWGPPHLATCGRDDRAGLGRVGRRRAAAVGQPAEFGRPGARRADPAGGGEAGDDLERLVSRQQLTQPTERDTTVTDRDARGARSARGASVNSAAALTSSSARRAPTAGDRGAVREDISAQKVRQRCPMGTPLPREFSGQSPK